MMLRILCVVLLVCLSLSPARTILAGEKQPGQEAELKQFRGRWTTSREKKEDQKVRRYQLVLEFQGSELKFFTEEDGKKENVYTLKVIGVEQGKDAPRLVLGYGQSKYAVYYDFQGEQMILVGSLLNRPFEGFSLAGAYKRVEKSK